MLVRMSNLLEADSRTTGGLVAASQTLPPSQILTINTMKNDIILLTSLALITLTMFFLVGYHLPKNMWPMIFFPLLITVGMAIGFLLH